jgi:hypothetical protein
MRSGEEAIHPALPNQVVVMPVRVFFSNLAPIYRKKGLSHIVVRARVPRGIDLFLMNRDYLR